MILNCWTPLLAATALLVLVASVGPIHAVEYGVASSVSELLHAQARMVKREKELNAVPKADEEIVVGFMATCVCGSDRGKILYAYTFLPENSAGEYVLAALTKYAEAKCGGCLMPPELAHIPAELRRGAKSRPDQPVTDGPRSPDFEGEHVLCCYPDKTLVGRQECRTIGRMWCDQYGGQPVLHCDECDIVACCHRGSGDQDAHECARMARSRCVAVGGNAVADCSVCSDLVRCCYREGDSLMCQKKTKGFCQRAKGSIVFNCDQCEEIDCCHPSKSNPGKRECSKMSKTRCDDLRGRQVHGCGTCR
jgi:hypothetical protein